MLNAEMLSLNPDLLIQFLLLLSVSKTDKYFDMFVYLFMYYCFLVFLTFYNIYIKENVNFWGS